MAKCGHGYDVECASPFGCLMGVCVGKASAQFAEANAEATGPSSSAPRTPTRDNAAWSPDGPHGYEAHGARQAGTSPATPDALPTVDEETASILKDVTFAQITTIVDKEVYDRIRAHIRKLHAAAALADDATYIINEMVDDEDCRLDHHGYCQEHLSFTDKCLNVRGQEWLVRDKERRTRSGQRPSSGDEDEGAWAKSTPKCIACGGPQPCDCNEAGE